MGRYETLGRLSPNQLGEGSARSRETQPAFHLPEDLFWRRNAPFLAEPQAKKTSVDREPLMARRKHCALPTMAGCTTSRRLARTFMKCRLFAGVVVIVLMANTPGLGQTAVHLGVAENLYFGAYEH